MNRGGLAGATWELDDRFTAYDTDHLVAANLDAGKMLLRIDPTDAGTVPTLEACAAAVVALNDRGLMAMVEPIPYRKDADGQGGVGRRPRRPAEGRRRERRARRVVGLHVAEDPGDGRHRVGRGDDDAAAADARWLPGPRSRGHVRVVGARARRSRRCAGWSSGGRCSTRPTATSRRPSAARRRPGRTGRGRADDEHAPMTRQPVALLGGRCGR